jgi:DNA-binding SARP family transcriptional activator
MTSNNNEELVTDDAEPTIRGREGEPAVRAHYVDNDDAGYDSESSCGARDDPNGPTDEMVGLIQNAYWRLLAGDPINAQRTLERALASRGVGTLAGARLNTARLVGGRAARRAPSPPSIDWRCTMDKPVSARIIVRTMGRFEITVDGATPGSRRKPPYRPLGMLKVLIANGGCAVSESVVIDALWPDLDGDHAHDARQVALHRLRKLLGANDAIAVNNGRMFIDEEQVWVDALALEGLLRIPVPGGNPERAEIALDLYKGMFLPQEVDAPWTVRMRECLRAKFVNVISKAAVELENARRYSTAASLYERGLAVDDLEGVLRTGLVRCLKSAGTVGASRRKS